MTMTRAEVETSWGGIPVRRGGEGPTVLLIHGLLVDGGPGASPSWSTRWRASSACRT